MAITSNDVNPKKKGDTDKEETITDQAGDTVTVETDVKDGAAVDEAPDTEIKASPEDFKQKASPEDRGQKLWPQDYAAHEANVDEADRPEGFKTAEERVAEDDARNRERNEAERAAESERRDEVNSRRSNDFTGEAEPGIR